MGILEGSIYVLQLLGIVCSGELCSGIYKAFADQKEVEKIASKMKETKA